MHEHAWEGMITFSVHCVEIGRWCGLEAEGTEVDPHDDGHRTLQCMEMLEKES